MRYFVCILFAFLLFVSASFLVSAQEKPAAAGLKPQNPSYILGAGDVLTVWALGVDEFANSKAFTVMPDGYVDLPLVGRLPAGGKSVEEVKQSLRHSLGLYFNDPQVSVTLM